MILGLNGLKGSGKDTVAGYLIKEHGFERRAFADPLKKSVAALFDISFSDIDKHKNNPELLVLLNGPTTNEPMASLTFREFLQRYGTESHRDVFGDTFWLDYTLPKDGFYSGRKIAITDIRFENEAKRIRAAGGFNVNINRPGMDPLDQHSSEQPLPQYLIDFKLDNVSTVLDLYDRVERMLTFLGEEQMERAAHA